MKNIERHAYLIGEGLLIGSMSLWAMSDVFAIPMFSFENILRTALFLLLFGSICYFFWPIYILRAFLGVIVLLFMMLWMRAGITKKPIFDPENLCLVGMFLIIACPVLYLLNYYFHKQK